MRFLPVDDIPGLGLWLCSLHSTPEPQYRAWLSADELARANRFGRERDRRRYLAARCALRECLSRYTGLAAGALQLADTPLGKPYVANVAGCFFNVSHSEDMALIGVIDSSDIGVDLEILQNIDNIESIARQHFSPAEFEAFMTLSETARCRVFLRVWTRKEACLKAVGTGLHIEPSTLEAGLDADPVQLTINTPTGAAQVEVRSIDPGPNALAAVARVLRS
jgi:4'-phosphopantetheinyl transferase